MGLLRLMALAGGISGLRHNCTDRSLLQQAQSQIDHNRFNHTHVQPFEDAQYMTTVSCDFPLLG